MVEIEFSVMENNAGDAERLRPLLDSFEKQFRIHVNLVGVPWYKGRAEVFKFGIFGQGPDLSSIGTTWVGSLASMQALRPFTAQEVRAVGGADAFFEANWKSGFLPNDPTPWAIPWLGDALVLHYWKDTFEKAGIHDIQAAFASDAALLETLKKLQLGGYPYPLALTTGDDGTILHETAHWIWNAGGDFISADRRQVAFDQPAAMEGLRNYFSLRPFTSPDSFSAHKAQEMYIDREAAVQVAGPWLGMIGRQLRPDLYEQLGVAQLPGKAYVGGCSFVIWKYSIHPQEAFELARFLSLQPIRFPASLHDHEVPVRREALYAPVTQNDDFNRTYMEPCKTASPSPPCACGARLKIN